MRIHLLKNNRIQLESEGKKEFNFIYGLKTIFESFINNNFEYKEVKIPQIICLSVKEKQTINLLETTENQLNRIIGTIEEIKNYAYSKNNKIPHREIEEENRKQTMKIEIYEKSKLQNQKALSWVKLGKKYGISDHTAKKYAYEISKLVQKRRKS